MADDRGRVPSNANPSTCRMDAKKTMYIGGTPFFAMMAVETEAMGATPVNGMVLIPDAMGDCACTV